MRSVKLAFICLALALCGCASGVKHADQDAVVQAAPKQETNVFLPTEPSRGDVAAIHVEKVAFKLGVSSNTVEKLAWLQGCDSAVGAGLITDSGPVEVYRVTCRDGSAFLAKCELRQCKPMQKNQNQAPPP